ncbi:hypothetical protein F4703DRAFT_1956125 [Phycomyces blakesleeanus]
MAVVAVVAVVVVLAIVVVMVVVAVLLTKMRPVLKHKFPAELTFLGTTIMKPNYMSLVNMPNTQLRDERWDQMVVTFKRLLSQNGLDVGASNDMITPRKLQDKWADLKNFHSVQRTLNRTGVRGDTGEERCPYYNYVFEILHDDPSENSGINVESMVCDWRHGVTISMTSRAEASIAELQRNIEVAASASAVASVEPSLLSTSDMNIATATSNSNNSAGPSSRLPTRGTRRTRKEYEAERDDMLFERLLGMHRESEECTKEVLHSLAASMREESEALRRDQQQQHQQMLEMLERIAREPDNRLLSVIGPFFNTRNRNGENNNNDNNS